jgi:hypothetical protein
MNCESTDLETVQWILGNLNFLFITPRCSEINFSNVLQSVYLNVEVGSPACCCFQLTH